MNRPVNLNDPTGHDPILLLVLFLVGVISVTSAVDMMETHAMEMNITSHQNGFAQEQSAISQWQDNCMGACHYRPSVTPFGSTGPRPPTPLTNQYSSEMAGAAQDIMQFVGGGAMITTSMPPTTRYNNFDARMKFYIKPELEMDSLMDTEASLHDQARWSFEYRNILRSNARYMMADRERAIDLAVTEPNYTWEELVNHKTVNKGLSGDSIYLDIITSARKSRPSVNEYLGIHLPR